MAPLNHSTAAHAPMPHIGLAAHLPVVNAGLFLLQLVFTWVGFSQGDGAVERYETLITPAPYAFAIWNVIYVLTAVALGVDIFKPSLSLFTCSVKPNVFRVLFAFACIANASWCLLFNNGFVNLATIVITLLWLVLLPIYLFANYERRVNPFAWQPYVTSELAYRVYFAWTSAATVVSWAITCQEIAGGFLAVGSYLTLLALLVVLALAGVVYGDDPVIGVVAAWALVAIASKTSTSVTGNDLEKLLRLQSSAALAAGAILSMIVVSVVHKVVNNRLSRAALLVANTPKRGYRNYGAVKTTSDSP